MRQGDIRRPDIPLKGRVEMAMLEELRVAPGRARHASRDRVRLSFRFASIFEKHVGEVYTRRYAELERDTVSGVVNASDILPCCRFGGLQMTGRSSQGQQVKIGAVSQFAMFANVFRHKVFMRAAFTLGRFPSKVLGKEIQRVQGLNWRGAGATLAGAQRVVVGH